MNHDDLIKLIFAFLMGGLGGAVGWLLKSHLDLKDRVIVLEGKSHALEEKAETIHKERVTVDHVRQVIEDALDKRDRAAEVRRVEWDKLHALEVERAIREQLAELVPLQTSQMEGMVRRVVQEIRGSQVEYLGPPSVQGVTGNHAGKRGD